MKNVRRRLLYFESAAAFFVSLPEYVPVILQKNSFFCIRWGIRRRRI